MRVRTKLLGIAAAGAAAISYVLCALAVALVPGPTNATFGYVMHVDLADVSRTVTWDSFFVGLIAFSAVVGLLVWLAAAFYGALLAREERSGALTPGSARAA